MILLISRERDNVLAQWRQRSIGRAIVSGISLSLVLLLAWLLQLHLRHLEASRNSLRESEASLRESETRFIKLFQHSPVPLALMRLSDDRLIDVNQVLLRQFGHQREDFIGTTPLTLPFWADPAERTPYLEQLYRQHHIENYEVRFLHHDGHEMRCLLSSVTLETGGEKVAVFSPIDVSRQHEIENRIREMNADLELRVQQRTQNLEQALLSLKTMQGELVRSEKMAALGSLVAGIAHELNTPIGNSVMIASSITDYCTDLLAEMQQARARKSVMQERLRSCSQNADTLVRNLQRAAELVRSFKQVAVDQSSNHRRRFDLRHVLLEVLLTLEPMYKKTRYSLHTALEPGITMESYPGALGQVITNCVSNALVHGFDGRSEGQMRLNCRQPNPHQVEISFSDDGTGIAPEHQARVFDPFFTTKLGQGGSGLGKHIVYNLVTNV